MCIRDRFNTAEDSWANNNGLTPDHAHEYNGSDCALKDYSHISAAVSYTHLIKIFFHFFVYDTKVQKILLL